MTEMATGVFMRIRGGVGCLRDPQRSLLASSSDIRVPRGLIREFGLEDGVAVVGECTSRSQGSELTAITTLGGLTPADFGARTRHKQLVAIDPCERFDLGAGGEMSMRIIDLLAPVGRGTRGLIVSPPKAGKTMILMSMAKAIRAFDPETQIIVLLVDERPEEVTHFRRSVDALVLASSSDHGVDQHIELSELTLAHVRTELECGRNVVLFVDSLTRMGRAFNARGSGTRRTMSGGVEAGALEVPRRFFGLARNVEQGGSVTIIATILIDTGSRMDELIFQEFKGTGNSEVVLDRTLAEQRIFPAIDPAASGTRKENLLYSDDDIRRINSIRRAMAGRKPAQTIPALIKHLESFPTNAEALANIPAR